MDSPEVSSVNGTPLDVHEKGKLRIWEPTKEMAGYRLISNTGVSSDSQH